MKRKSKKKGKRTPAARVDKEPEKTLPPESWLTRHVRGPIVPVGVIVLLAAFALQAVTSMSLKCATSDEIVDLSSGHAILARHDFRITPEHGVLPRVCAALPLLFMDINDGADSPEWREAKEWDYGFRFLHVWGNDCDEMLFWSRCMMVLMALGLGLLIFIWARQLYGNAAGLFALALYAFSPNILAHGRLVTTDVPLAFTMLLALFLFDRALRRITPLRAVLAGAAFGAALLTKFSAPMLLLLFVAMVLMRALVRAPVQAWFVRRFTLRTRHGKLAAMALVLLAVLAGSYLTTWAGYGFRFSAFASQDGRFSQRAGEEPKYRWMRGPYSLCMKNRLLPEAFLHGFQVISRVERRGSLAYLVGEGSRQGWRHYFIMTFLYKTPVPMMIFMLVAAALSFRISRGKRADEMPLYALFAVYYLASILSNINIGHRYIIPALPPLFILAGKLINHARMRDRTNTAFASVILVGLFGWYVYGTLSVYPHYLAYFNEIAGGPDHGHEHLTDSNLDWGQDLKLLKTYMDQNNIQEVHLAYWGNGSPRYYDINYQYLPCGVRDPGIRRIPPSIQPGDWVAISANMWTDSFYTPYHPGVMEYRTLRLFLEEEPVKKIGYSIWIFRARRPAEFVGERHPGSGAPQWVPVPPSRGAASHPARP